MSIWRFVLSSAGLAGLVMAGLGTAAAAFNGGLVAVVHRALSAGENMQGLALAFIGLALGKVVSAYASGRLAEAFSQTSIARLRGELIDKLLGIPYRRFEEIGPARANAALTRDIMILNSALESTAQALVNGAILAGGLVYLAYLDPTMCVAMLALAALGSAIYFGMNRRVRSMLADTRNAYDRFYSDLGALTEGTKELKLHAGRRRAFVDGRLRRTIESMAALELQSRSRSLLGQAANSLLVLVMIGLVLFALPKELAMRSGLASGYVLTGLYMTGPLTSLLHMFPLYAAAQVALTHIEALGITLGSAVLETDAPHTARPTFTSIELRGVSHRYGAEGFELAPITLTLQPGEIVFVTGSNGSGKSTLAKLLVGLYEPLAGKVLWDGRPVTLRERDLYRQLFSTVFSDFYLFDELYGLASEHLNARSEALLTELDLGHALSIRDGVLSTVALSQGQRKRLALLTALLEDRPIYVLDEWAAEQDKAFRAIFYEKLLPGLKARGKTVVVISHDDRYFKVADRLVALVDGRAQNEPPKVA